MWYSPNQNTMNKSLFILTVISMTISLLSCDQEYQEMSSSAGFKYVPDDIELHEQIVKMDKIFFNAYNTCDLETQGLIYADDIEFYHDKGGLMTSKKEILDGTERNICGKVTRELVQGSIEVYPIHNYGAVQIGYHKFYNNQEPDAESKPSKFITMWHNDNGNWQISKVISLH